MPRWGDFQKDGKSKPGFRQYAAILWDIPWGVSWEQTCANMPAIVRGHQFSRPTRCVNNGANMWGEFDVPDSTFSSPVSYGRFSGDVETRWIDDGRRMEILKDFSYIDPHGIKWVCPKGWIVDGASIPQAAWSVIGGPFSGLFRKASVIHDYACDRKDRPWTDVHWAFHEAMIAEGNDLVKAQTMFAMVWQFGPRW